MLALREWAEEQAGERGLADRDDAPSHTDRAWQQVSIPVRECLGPQRCPYGDECFVERSRDEARAADLVVTNHALLAINAMHGGTALPEHSAVIIDEAHELVARVTGAASAELSPAQVERVGKRALTYLEDDVALELLESADVLRTALDGTPLERVEDPDSAFVAACATVRNAARTAVSAMTGGEGKLDADKRQAAAAVQEVFDIAERMAALKEHDVVWVADRERFGREARVSPLSVSALMRRQVFGERTTILTSATLKLGGDFTGIAASVGLRADERIAAAEPTVPADSPEQPAADQEPRRTTTMTRCRGAPWMSARRSTIAGRASSTSPDRCRRRGGTGSRRPRWPRSPSWSGRRAAGRWGSSPPGGPPRRRRSTSASSCRS